MIEAVNIVKEFTKVEKKNRKSIKSTIRAVDGITLAANDGETLGILGPNGAGKTTLLRILGTLMAPTSGSVRHTLADGTALDKPEHVKKEMGYLSNNTKLYQKLSAREMLMFVGEIYGYSKDAADERVSELNSYLGMQEFIDSRIGSLSTGQTQRVSIARCMFAEPSFYILDEPTLGLDIMSSSSIVEFVKEEKKKNKTIIYSTHYLEEAQSMCDRVVLLNRGRIIADGSVDAICANSGTASLREAFLDCIGKDGGAI